MENFGDQDLAATFFRSLDTALRKLMEADGFHLHIRAAGEKEHEAYNCIDDVYKAALKSEKRAAANNTLAQVVGTPLPALRPQSMTSAYPAVPEYHNLYSKRPPYSPQPHNPEISAEKAAYADMRGTTSAHPSSPYSQPPPSAELLDRLDSQASDSAIDEYENSPASHYSRHGGIHNIVCCLSAAEEAIRLVK